MRLGPLRTPPGLELLGTFAVVIVACRGPADAPPATPATTEQGFPLWLDEVAQRCALIASCAHAHDTPRLRDPSACVDWWVAHVRSVAEPVHKCLATAKTCEQIGACVREKPDARAAAYCAARPGVLGGCDGERLVSCGEDESAESTATDCAGLGARCAESKAAGGLMVRGCFAPAICPAAAPEARCDGATILSCHDGAVERTACSPGTRCEQHKDRDGETAVTCEPPENHAHCEELGARYCDQNRLVECVVHGHFGDVRISECGALGLACRGKGERARCVVAPRLECDPAPPRCDGEALSFCAAGHLARVSCRGLGLGACDPDARGPQAGCRVDDASHARAAAASP